MLQGYVILVAWNNDRSEVTDIYYTSMNEYDSCKIFSITLTAMSIEQSE